MAKKLPQGQKDFGSFPRFGLGNYVERFPTTTDKINITISGDLDTFQLSTVDLDLLERTDQLSDFHCVTTWSALDLKWSGYKFSEFYDKIILPKINGNGKLKFVVMRAQDGYRTSLLLEDLLADDVLLADQLDGEPLSIEHGAPVRIVAPAHYGYKNPKHLDRLEFYFEQKKFKTSSFRFMDHPRARVAKEERAMGGPGWLFRYLYRPLVGSTVKKFAQAMNAYREKLK